MPFDLANLSRLRWSTSCQDHLATKSSIRILYQVKVILCVFYIVMREFRFKLTDSLTQLEN